MSDIFWIGFQLDSWRPSFTANSHNRYDGEMWQSDDEVDDFSKKISGVAKMKVGDDSPPILDEIKTANVTFVSSRYWFNSGWVYDRLREGNFSLGSMATFGSSASLGLNIPVDDFVWLFPNAQPFAEGAQVLFECEFREVEAEVFQVLRYRIGEWG